MLAIASSSVSLEPARVEFWGDGVGRFNAPRLTHTQRAKHSKKGAECDDLTHPPVFNAPPFPLHGTSWAAEGGKMGER